MPGLVPGISRFCAGGRPVIASAAKQSIRPLCRTMDCFAALAVTWRVQREGISRHSLRAITGSRVHTTHNFFIIFVDGIFTTFIACLFTNTSHAIRENPAISCV